MNPLSDSDFLAEQKALRIAMDAQKKCHADFIRAMGEAASPQTVLLLGDLANEVAGFLGDLNGQKELVREAHRAKLPPRIEAA